MAIVTGYTAEKMDEISNSTVVGGSVNSTGNLILVTRDGRTIDAGRMSTSFLESLVPPIVHEVMADDATIAEAGRTAAASAVASELATQGDTILKAARWNRGAIPAGQDLNTFYTPGLYRISSTGVPNQPPTPTGGVPSGFVNVYNIDASNATWAVQEFYRYGIIPERWWRVSRDTTGTWNAWERLPTASELTAIETALKTRMDTMTASADWVKGTISSEVDLDTFIQPGLWRVSTTFPKNLPEFNSDATPSGFVMVANDRGTGRTWAYQEYIRYGVKPERWWRVSRNTTGTWGPWTEVGSTYEGITNELLIQDFTRRRGGIKTVNTGVVALRFDHGLKNFNSKIRPVLERLNLPYSLALCSGQWERAENVGVTPYMVDSWVAGGLAEIWNHTKEHGSGAGLRKDWRAAILDGLTELRQQLPSAKIDGFAIPGSAGTSFGGFTTGASAEEFYNTEGGRYILANHAVSSGYIPDTSQRILDGNVRQGLGHYTFDSATVENVNIRVRAAESGNTGLQLMLHPSLVDTTGYMTTANVTAVLEYIAAERDAGRIAVMGPYDMLLAKYEPNSRRVVGIDEAVDLNTLNTEGQYVIRNLSATNSPEAKAGILEVSKIASNAIQKFTTFGSPSRVYHRYRGVDVVNWSEWLETATASTSLPSTTDLNTLYTSARFAVSNTGNPNLPEVGRIGILEVLRIARSAVQRFTVWGNNTVWVRWANVDNGSWSAWTKQLNSSDLTAVTAQIDSSLATARSERRLAPGSGYKNAQVALNQPSGASVETISAAMVRWPLTLGVASHRARLHIRNWSPVNGTKDAPFVYSGAVSFTGLWMGKGDGKDFVETPKQVLPAFTTAANGAEYVSGWFNYDISEDDQHLVSLGFTNAAGQTNYQGRGGCWRSTNPQDASALTPDATLSAQSPFDVWLELEVPATTPILAGFGDSNTVGTGTTLPVHDSWLSQYCRRNRAIPLFVTNHGSNASSWTDETTPRWNRFAGTAPADAGVYFLHQNDISETVTLDEMKQRYRDTVAIFKSKITPNVYSATVTPASNKPAAAETIRRDFNTWLKTKPTGERDCFDFAAAISDNDTAIRTEDNADNLHFNTGGHLKLAKELEKRPVTPRVLTRSEITRLLNP